jgi:hypothetical protein
MSRKSMTTETETEVETAPVVETNPIVETETETSATAQADPLASWDAKYQRVAAGVLRASPKSVLTFGVSFLVKNPDRCQHFVFVRQDTGDALYDGVSAKGLATRLKSLQAHPVNNANLHARLLPHAGCNVVCYDEKTRSADMSVLDAARARSVVMHGVIGNASPRTAIIGNDVIPENLPEISDDAGATA